MEGDGVRHAAIHEATTVAQDGAGYDGQRGRGTNPLQIVIIQIGQFVIDRLARVYVGADHMEMHGIAEKRLGVNYINLRGDGVVTEVGVDIVARAEQRTETHVMRVSGHLNVVAEGATNLFGLEVDAEASTCRNAYRVGKSDAVLEEDVNDARGEEAAHATALQD